MILPSQVLEHFGLSDGAVSLLHHGENVSFKVVDRDSGRSIVIKRLRNDRPQIFSAEGEMSWLLALGKRLSIVQPFSLDRRSNLTFADGFLYAGYSWCNGEEPDDKSVEVHERAGQLLRKLHENGREVLAAEDSKWLGRCRPFYNHEFVIEKSMASVKSSGVFDSAQLRTLQKQAEILAAGYKDSHQFIHGDFHLGNLLSDGGSLKILDFDECGFGPIAYDLGTLRLHTLANQQEDCWQAFLRGYGVEEMGENRYGAAARVLFMIGKIPNRLDVPDLRDRASAVMVRYQEYIAQILDE